MANAAANLDSLRWLAARPSEPDFAHKTVAFFRSHFDSVQERPKLTGRSGNPFHPTLAVGGARDYPVYVQAISSRRSQSRQRAAYHSFTMFSDVDGALSTEHKMVMLEDVRTWGKQLIRLLASVAYVSSWESREQLVEFIQGGSPRRDTLLLTAGEQEQMSIGQDS